MRDFFDSKVPEEIVIQSPADVVMAAEIILEYIFPGKCGYNIKLAAQQRNISCGDSMPGACHGGHVVKKVTFWFFHCSKIGNHFFRSHNDFSKKEHARADDFADHPHHTDNGVDLRKIAAVGAKLLPDIGNSVKTYNVHSLVSQIKHIEDHFIQYNRIAVVQIPLIRIESGHYMFFDIIQPGEVARSCSWEYLRAGLLVQSRDIIAVKEEITILIFFFSGAGALCPLVILRRMVHHKVQTYADPPFMAGGSYLGKILHCSKFRLNGTEIRNRVSAVAASFGRRKKGH